MGIISVHDAIHVSCIHRITLQHIETGNTITSIIKNTVVSLGKNMLARRLAGEENACDLTYGAVGTGITPPVPGDTELENEVFRKQITQRSASGNQVRITLYFGPQEANDTLREYAFFGEDATVTPGSGTMFNRAAIEVSKTSSYTMTIDSTLTFS